MNFNMLIPTQIIFGQGQLNNLGALPMPGKRAMIIISNGKATRANGYLQRTEEQLKKANVLTFVFDKIQANPLKSTVMLGGKFAKENHCDFIVALGGGSCMDAAKAIAVMATNDGDLWDYISGGTGKGNPYKNNALPIIAITTTAGTGSEVDAWGVITNEETHEKMGFGGKLELFPRVAIVDPELMVSVPPMLTAFQGFDAFFHSVECYIANTANIMCDMYSLTAIKDLAKHLPIAVKDGSNIDSREKVAFANTLAGVAMCLSSCTSEHSLEHAMSAYHQELPHGAGLIMISKAYFTHFINAKVCDDRFIDMAKAMGNEKANHPMDFIAMLDKMQAECGVSQLKMSDYGIETSQFKTLSENAKFTMGGLFTRDRVELSVDDCIAIYKNSFK